MITTTTRAQIRVSRRSCLDCGVVVGVVVREHNNYPTQKCYNCIGFLNRGG